MSGQSAPQDIFVQYPAYPKTGSELFRKLKQSLDKTECAPGVQLMQTELGQLLGMPKSTANDWYHGKLPIA